MPRTRPLTEKQRAAWMSEKQLGRIAERLLLYKKKNGLTVKTLAEKLCVCEVTALKLLDGKPVAINTDVFLAVLRVAGIKLSEAKEDVWT